MCIIKNVKDSLVVNSFNNMAPVLPSSSSGATSSESSGALVHIMKPKLPRKVTRTPRINLNKYWNILEDIMTDGNSKSGGKKSSESVSFEEHDMNNEINENISNEQKENEYEYNSLNQNERNVKPPRRNCSCHWCLISNLRNISVSENCEEATEL